ncbi:MAG TPA: hypothetical protein VIW01_13860 [Dehalococcoidia bacterium]
MGEEIAVSVATECVHCSEPMHLDIDSAGRGKVAEAEADPVVFVPRVDFSKLADKCITDVF